MSELHHGAIENGNRQLVCCKPMKIEVWSHLDDVVQKPTFGCRHHVTHFLHALFWFAPHIHGLAFGK